MRASYASLLNWLYYPHACSRSIGRSVGLSQVAGDAWRHSRREDRRAASGVHGAPRTGGLPRSHGGRNRRAAPLLRPHGSRPWRWAQRLRRWRGRRAAAGVGAGGGRGGGVREDPARPAGQARLTEPTPAGASAPLARSDAPARLAQALSVLAGRSVGGQRSVDRSINAQSSLSVACLLACCHGWTGRISCQRSSIPMQTIHLLISSHLPPSNAQVLILRSAGQWSEEALQAAAEFLGLSHAAASVKRAGTATYTGPEHFKFNKGASQGGDGSTTGHSRAPMLAATREILLSFFNDHWDAALEDHTPSDPCAASRRSLPV